MEGSHGLSDSQRRDLLARIDRLVGGTPKGKLVRKIVEELPAEGDAETSAEPGVDQSGSAPSG